MTFVENIPSALVSLGVVAGICWIIFTGMAKKNPKMKEYMHDVFKREDKKTTSPKEFMQQVYPEKRQIM